MFDFTYCEHVPFAFIAHPLNTISSLGFFLVAYLLHKQFKGTTDTKTVWLIRLTWLIGIGSMVWHTAHTSSTLWWDMLPIFAFLLLYQYTFMTTSLAFTMQKALVWVVVFLGVMALSAQVGNEIFLQKSNAFVPVVLWLLLMVRYVRVSFPGMQGPLYRSAGVFSLAILFRIIDVPVCGTLPLGSHFLWHLLSALSLYYAMQALRVRGATMNAGS